jgi:class 3 adenylate cyclase
MRRIGNGHLDTHVEIYDTSEIGTLQTGFNEMAIGLAERERLHDLFGRHVGRDVARHALEQGVALTGRVCISAVLFIDLAGSTAFAALNPPHRVAGLLNTFFALVVETVNRHHGFVNKFEGDAALVIFGAPLPHDDPAGAALACARDLSAELAARTDMLNFGVGVAHGRVFAGNIGAEDRYEYTVIGDPVNEAARLSDLAKTRPHRVLASAVTVSSAAADESAHWSSGEGIWLRGRTSITVIAEPRTEPT